MLAEPRPEWYISALVQIRRIEAMMKELDIPLKKVIKISDGGIEKRD